MKKLILAILILGLISTPAFSAAKWRNGIGEDSILGSESAADIDFVSFNHMTSPLDRMLSDYRMGATLEFVSIASVKINIGEVMCSSSDGSVRRMRANTSAITLTFASNLDTGSEAVSTTYSVFAVCDADATTFTGIISANSSTPTGVTYWKKVGTFFNDAGSDIEQTKIFTESYGPLTGDANGKAFINEIYSYGTSQSSSTLVDRFNLKIAFGEVTGITTNSDATISNLPFSGTSYYVSATAQGANTNDIVMKVHSKTSSSFGIRNAGGVTTGVDWIAIGQ